MDWMGLVSNRLGFKFDGFDSIGVHWTLHWIRFEFGRGLGFVVAFGLRFNWI